MSKSRSLAPKSEEALLEKGRRLRAEAKQLCHEFRQKEAHIRWLIEDIRRQWQPDFHRPLQAAIRAMHGCESQHLASFALRKVADGTTVWEETVEEFHLIGHPQAVGCYAWTYQEHGKSQSFSVLELPPVYTPHHAVQLALAAHELGKKPVEESSV